MINKDRFLVYTFDSMKMGPLHWACLRNYFPMVKMLLIRGAYVDQLDCVIYKQRHRTPLHLAVKIGDVKTIEELLKSGADPVVYNNSK